MIECGEVYKLIWENISKATEDLNLTKQAKILDVGCWDGELTEKISKKTRIDKDNLYGIDVFDNVLAQAKKKGIKTAKVDLENEKFPFPDNYFDVVICNQVFEHLKNIYSPIDEIHRVLKQGGYLIFSVPNLSSFHNKIFLFFGFQPTSIRSIGPHIRGFTFREVVSFLQLNDNFKVTRTYGTGFYPFPIQFARLVSRILSSNSHTVIFVAKKISKNGSWSQEVRKIEECSTTY